MKLIKTLILVASALSLAPSLFSVDLVSITNLADAECPQSIADNLCIGAGVTGNHPGFTGGGGRWIHQVQYSIKI